MRIFVTAAIAAALITMPVASLQAQSTARISASTLATALADGKPWNFTVPDGKTGRMIFNKDGSGQLIAPRTMKISWVIKGQEFCIKMGMMLGTRCVTATQVKNGYQTYQKNKPGFLFTR